MSNGGCRSCGARIIWVRKTDGKGVMPLEPCAVADGNIRVDPKTGCAVVGPRGSGPYRSHFVSCPQANDWRRGGKGGEAA